MIKMLVSPENSQSYAIAAVTMGTDKGLPNSDVKPETLAVFPLFDKMWQYFQLLGSRRDYPVRLPKFYRNPSPLKTNS